MSVPPLQITYCSFKPVTTLKHNIDTLQPPRVVMVNVLANSHIQQTQGNVDIYLVSSFLSEYSCLLQLETRRMRAGSVNLNSKFVGCKTKTTC